MLNWGDDLRLPTFTDPTEIEPILTQLNEHKISSIPFQSKHLPSLKRNVWFVLKRPDDAHRPGMLCIWPLKKCCIFVLGKRVALLRLRIDPHLLAEGTGISVFVATLSHTTRRLLIEDTLVWKGRVLEHETFTKRWECSKQWVDHCVIPDSRLMNGIEVELANWRSLVSLQSDGSWDLIADDSRTRMYWKGSVLHPLNQVSASSTKLSQPERNIETKPTPEPKFITKPQPNLIVQDTIVAAAKRESGPDQWSLSSSDGTSLGRALIRKMKISSLMNNAGPSVFVEVSWTTGFNKWEITAIHSGPASPSSFFTVSK